jgi:DNA-directed RNA polymerase subunit RPC12/RpoP
MMSSPAERGAVVEVLFDDGVWYRGRLIKRIPFADPPRWRVRFDDGKERDDIDLDSSSTPVRFDAAAYHALVEVKYDRSWYRGRLVELMEGNVEWGVAFEDGDWAEDVRLGDQDVRYISALDTTKRKGKKRKRDDGSDMEEVEDLKEGKLHCCSDCGKTFSRSSSLAVHMRVHSGQRPYECSTCTKAFSRSSDLARHMRVHSGERPHKCLTCGKAFSTSSHLATHMLVHSGERPHKCETCGKAFSTSSHLAVHMRVHSGERPYECLTCGKTFAQSGDLAKHMRVHSRERPYECFACGKAFAQSSHLTKHMRGCMVLTGSGEFQTFAGSNVLNAAFENDEDTAWALLEAGAQKP